jgi:predicted SnoaL-like aldol condensation-catalyzing enzyme
MSSSRKDAVQRLLKGIESGDAAAAAVVNEDKYIQHNPQTHEGSEGLAALFKRLSESSPRVNIVRIFADGDYVFGHTEYDFATSNIGFEIFRFEGDQAVEHWDNIQRRAGPNTSGHDMISGSTDVANLGLTETNRALVRAFIEEVLLQQNLGKLEDYIDRQDFVQHNPTMADGVAPLREALTAKGANHPSIQYTCLHKILAEGNFVLAVSEGYANGVHSSFFDLYRISANTLVEHWDTVEAIPPRSEWKNDNGKFCFPDD